MPLVDFHCHLTESGGFAALPDGTPSLFDAETVVVSVTNRPSDWRAMSRGASGRPVAWGLGLHPELVHDDKTVDQFLEALPLAEVVGEVGLDFAGGAQASERAQRAVFERVISAPETSRRIVSIHSRGATRDVLSMLRGQHLPGAILHWFLGAVDDIDRAIDSDLYFSVNESMLSRPRGKAVVAALPPNRVLLETDAPYGGSGGRPSRPGHLAKVVASLGRLWARPVAETQALIESNQANLLARTDVIPAALRPASHSEDGSRTHV